MEVSLAVVAAVEVGVAAVGEGWDAAREGKAVAVAALPDTHPACKSVRRKLG